MMELSKDQITKLNSSLAAIKAAKGEIARAKAAGIPIEDQEAKILEQEKKLLALKRVYVKAGS